MQYVQQTSVEIEKFAGTRWNDWVWQMGHRLRCLEDFEAFLTLTEVERAGFDEKTRRMPVAVTPYYAALIDPDDPDDPIRRTVIPRRQESEFSEHEHMDPLGEEAHQPVPGLVHTYPDKVLLLVTRTCATYCRYCTRSRRAKSESAASMDELGDALSYIRQHAEIRDVLISGGDPLTLSDAFIDELLTALRAIEHVEIIRIGTKVPMVLPQRITHELTSILRAHQPLWLVIHATHPRELTMECGEALARLADAGIPLASQTVLLRGVNDQTETIKSLMEGLLRRRVRPYYLHLCDAAAGTGHFKAPVETGLEIIRALHGFTTGLAVPLLMVDAPGGGGKVPLMPDYVVDRDVHGWRFRSPAGLIYPYFDPANPSPTDPCQKG